MLGTRLEHSSLRALATYLATESGLNWNFTTLLVLPLPPSMCCTARVDQVDHSPLPFQPVRASSMRPSRPLAKKPSG